MGELGDREDIDEVEEQLEVRGALLTRTRAQMAELGEVAGHRVRAQAGRLATSARITTGSRSAARARTVGAGSSSASRRSLDLVLGDSYVNRSAGWRAGRTPS